MGDVGIGWFLAVLIFAIDWLVIRIIAKTRIKFAVRPHRVWV
jgi:hypothetical protein